VGATAQLGHAQPSRPPAWAEAWVAYDWVADSASRFGLASDFTLADDAGDIGLAAIGDIWSDASFGRDYRWSPWERRRRDRHALASAWVGSPGGHRVWMGIRQRAVASAPASATATPAVHFGGSTPSLGYAAAVPFRDWGSVQAHLRFDRFGGDLDGAPSHNAVSVVTGGQLRLLQVPALSVYPGVWVELASQFSDPSDVSNIRRFESRVVGTLELSSPWLRGGPGAWHLIELGASARLVGFRNVEDQSDVDGGFPSPPPQLQSEARVTNALRVGRLRVDVPLRWIREAGPVASRLVADADLTWEGPVVSLRIGQHLAFDTRDLDFPLWRARGRVGLRPGGGGDIGDGVLLPPPALEIAVGGRIAIVGAEERFAESYRIASLPYLLSGFRPAVPDGTTVGGGYLEILTGVLSGTLGADWLGDSGDTPDLWAGLWWGHPRGLRLAGLVSVQADDTVLGHLTLQQSAWP
jgi:hypothetical protein